MDSDNTPSVIPPHRNFEMSRREFLRRSLATWLAASSVGGMLAACTDPVAQPTTTLEASSPSGGLTGTITVSYPDEIGKKPPYVTAAADALKLAHPQANVEIDLQRVSAGDYLTRLLLALDAQAGPDVIHVGGDFMGGLVDAGYDEPLDAYVANWDDWKFYPDSVKQAVTYKGHVYGIPFGLNVRFLYYRRDIFERAGLPREWQPTNVYDILIAAKEVQTNVPEVIPYVIYAGQAGASGTANHGFVPTLLAFGGELKDTAGKWIGDSPALRKALAYYERAYLTDNLVPTEVLTTTQPWLAMREKFGKGELAILFEGGWVYGGWAGQNKEDTETNVGYLLYPTETTGPSFTVGGTGPLWMINSQSQNKDLAWEFIKTWNNRDTVARLNIEDPNPVARTDSAELPEFQTQKFLVDSTRAVTEAKFSPVDGEWSQVMIAIQAVTGRVASGEATVDEAVQRFIEDLREAVGNENVVTL